MGGDPNWQLKADRLAQHIAGHGNPPSKADADPDVARLGEWVGTQRQLAKKGQLTNEEIQFLDGSAPGWRGRVAQQDAHISWCAAFITEHGRFPSTVGGRGMETRVAAFLRRSRERETDGRATPAEIAELDARVPGWRTPSLVRTFEESAGLLGKFVVEHGRFPSDRRADADEEETRLGVFLTNQRRHTSNSELSESRRAVLDANAPGWDGYRNDEAWNRQLVALVAFHASTGRFPELQSGVHATLGRWLYKQRTSLRDGKLDAHRTAHLDAAVPGWQVRDDTIHDTKWFASASKVAAHREEYGQFPSSTSHDETVAKLGWWLVTQRTRQRKGVLSPGRAAHLNEHLPGWEGTYSHDS